VDVQAYDATIVVDADIGVTVQAYDADTAKYDDTTANFSGTLQNGGSNVLVDSDIGSTVQAYSGNLASINQDLGNTDSPTFADLTLTGNLDVSGESVFSEIKETVYTLGTSGNIDLNPANGSIQTCELTGAATFVDQIESGQTVVLMVGNADTHAVTWPSTTWYGPSGNTAPTATNSDTVVFWKVSSNLYSAYVGSGD
jgi:hypothetical protein